MVAIREYAESDYTLLRTLVNDLQDYGASIDPLKRIRRGETYGTLKVEQILKNVTKQQGKILFAQDELGNVIGCIIGFVLAQDEENLQEVIPCKTGYINRLYISPFHRKRGMATQLLNYMEAYFRTLGCSGVWIEADAYNPQALRLYQKQGYQPREIHFLKQI